MKTMERARSWCWFAAVAIAALAFAGGASAATVYWTNTDATATWTAPDSTHFSTAKIGSAGSPATYQNGDTVQFGDLGSLPVTDSTISIAAGGVTPNAIYMYTPRGVNRVTFNIGENNALGTASFDTDYQVSTTFNNTKGTGSANEVTLSNNFIYANSYALVFTGGDFLLTGTINGGGNAGPRFDPVSGVTVTLQNGVSGNYFTKDYAAGTLRILAASSGKLVAIYNGTIEVWHDQALGPGSDQFSTITATLIAGGGARTLAQNAQFRTVTIDGTNNLTLNGVIVGGDAYTFTKNGAGTCTLNGTNGTWMDLIVINAGALVAGQTNALGSGSITVNSNGTLAIGSGVDFTRAVTFNAGSALGGSGSFTRGAAWSLPAGFTVRPGMGATPGTLSVNTASGGMTFGDGRTLEIDLSGTNADRLVLDGALTLSGTTDKLLLRGAAKPGTYVIASAAGISGVFDEEDLTGLVNTSGKVIYQSDQILFVVPARGTVVSVH